MTNYGFHSAMRDGGVEVAVHAGRRPPRAGRAAAPRLGARGRAVRPHHRHGFVPSGDGTASALLTLEALGGPRPRRARRDGEAAPAARERQGGRPRRAGGRRMRSGQPIERGVGAPGGSRPGARAHFGYRATDARDGGGARARPNARRSSRELRVSSNRGYAESTAMCGIIGYVGPNECRDLLLEGLQRLEYRGYDSAGLSLITNGSVGTFTRSATSSTCATP